MLVLTRKKGESLLIGKDITITVVDITGDRIRIGIEAPKSLDISRTELIEETKSVNIESSKNRPGLTGDIVQLIKENADD